SRFRRRCTRVRSEESESQQSVVGVVLSHRAEFSECGAPRLIRRRAEAFQDTPRRPRAADVCRDRIVFNARLTAARYKYALGFLRRSGGYLRLISLKKIVWRTSSAS